MLGNYEAMIVVVFMMEVVLVLGIVLYNLIGRTDTMVVVVIVLVVVLVLCIMYYVYLARKLWHKDAGSCCGAGCIGIRSCIKY